MYSKTEASNIKKQFWTAFGLYMKPVLNAAGESVNWLNYKTGIRLIYFRMDVDHKRASVSIEIKQSSTEERLLVFKKFGNIKNLFFEQVDNNWIWQDAFYDEDGKCISKIATEKNGVNIFNKEDWPAIISFLKERIVKLDAFWHLVKFQFE